MHVNDLRNLLVLARKGMAVVSENLQADEAKACWEAIKNVETFINSIIEQQKQKMEEQGGNPEGQNPQPVEGDGKDPTQVHVVDLTENKE